MYGWCVHCGALLVHYGTPSRRRWVKAGAAWRPARCGVALAGGHRPVTEPWQAPTVRVLP